MTSVTTPLQQQTIADTAANWSQPLAFAQFDPSLGTLTGVAFGLTGDVSGSILLQNLDRAPARFSVGFNDGITLVAPGGAIVASASPYASASPTLAAGATAMLDDVVASAS